MLRVVIISIFLLPFSLNCFAGLSLMDSLENHSPRRATIKSAILPGWGQLYNKKYWKIPVIYAGFGVMAYLIKMNHCRYSDYRDAYRVRTDGDSLTMDIYNPNSIEIGLTPCSSDGSDHKYTESNLLKLRDFYRRNRDLTVIITALLYVINIVDASVDAHLFYFEVSDDLSLQADPILKGHNKGELFAGLNLKLNF
ncbi:hypothetical protein JYU23_00510 [bacterium AH-315-C07]|nr:hypothetical protein [bacterium AH-315-C07]